MLRHLFTRSCDLRSLRFFMSLITVLYSFLHVSRGPICRNILLAFTRIIALVFGLATMGSCLRSFHLFSLACLCYRALPAVPFAIERCQALFLQLESAAVHFSFASFSVGYSQTGYGCYRCCRRRPLCLRSGLSTSPLAHSSMLLMLYPRHAVLV